MTRSVAWSTYCVETTTTPRPDTDTVLVGWTRCPCRVNTRAGAPIPTVPGVSPVSSGAGTASSSYSIVAMAIVVASLALTGPDSASPKACAGAASAPGSTITVTDSEVVLGGKRSVPEAGSSSEPATAVPSTVA